MKNGLYLSMFIAGAVAGSAVTWHYAKQKYERIAQEEIDSVKEVFTRKEGYSQTNDGIRIAADQTKEKPDIVEYTAMVHKYGGSAAEEKKDVMKEKDPYVISPEEFGEFEDYEKISLTYYGNGVLADDNDEIMEDIVDDILDHFGEYEDDSVFVRCDERKCDYEILFDRRNFSDVASSKPRRVEI